MSDGAIRQLSDLIDSTYSPDLDPEAHTYRRVNKIVEEVGEVQEALFAVYGENPRKGQVDHLNYVIAELLDVALAALGAVAHLTHEKVDPLALLEDHTDIVLNRLEEVLGL